MAWPSTLARTKDWGTEILTDADLEGQFDLIITYINDMMDASTGHKHDGTSSEGPKILTANIDDAAGSQGDVFYSSGTAITRLAAGTSGQFLQTKGAAANPVWASQTTPAFENQLLHVREEQAADTDGGTFTNGAWRTRTLNTTKTNEITGASLGSNQITLPSGTYFIIAQAPSAGNHDGCKVKLRNTSDASDEIIGTTTWGSGNTNRLAMVYGRFTIAAEKVFEIQHRVETSVATTGLGFGANLAVVEVYTEVMIWKVA